MVSANNLCLDVLDLIFSNLFAHELCAVCLVSHSFFDAAIPHLYHTLFYRRKQAKRFKYIMSPFAVVLTHPEYSVYVRVIDVRSVPATGGKVHPRFESELENALKTCNNLRSLTCTTSKISFKILNFVSQLENKKYIQEIRISAVNFSETEANFLLDFNSIRNLSLAWGSWTVLNTLSDWSRRICGTLTSLTFFMCSLNETILESILCQLTHLSALHVLYCPHISSSSVLRLTKYTPALHSLSLDVQVAVRENPILHFLLLHCQQESVPSTLMPSSLRLLRQLCLNITCTDDYNQPNLAFVLSYFRAMRAPLSGICIYRRATWHYSPGAELLHDYGGCLQTFVCHGPLETSCINAICDSCPNLEELAIPIPMHEFVRLPFQSTLMQAYRPFQSTFAAEIRQLRVLRTLRDTRVKFELHLTRDKVTHLMGICRRLECIISGDRIWTLYVDARGNQEIGLGDYRMDDSLWLAPTYCI